MICRSCSKDIYDSVTWPGTWLHIGTKRDLCTSNILGTKAELEKETNEVRTETSTTIEGFPAQGYTAEIARAKGLRTVAKPGDPDFKEVPKQVFCDDREIEGINDSNLTQNLERKTTMGKLENDDSPSVSTEVTETTNDVTPTTEVPAKQGTDE